MSGAGGSTAARMCLMKCIHNSNRRTASQLLPILITCCCCGFVAPAGCAGHPQALLHAHAQHHRGKQPAERGMPASSSSTARAAATGRFHAWVSSGSRQVTVGSGISRRRRDHKRRLSVAHGAATAAPAAATLYVPGSLSSSSLCKADAALVCVKHYSVLPPFHCYAAA